MTKQKKTIVMLLSLGLIVLFVSLTAIIALVIFLKGPFVECDSQAIVNHLEQKYGVVFPKTDCEIRAARTWRIPVRSDDGQDFVMRMSGDPDILLGFAKAYCRFDKMDAYHRNFDIRYVGFRIPKWFLEPITSGRQGPADWRETATGAQRNTRIYVDTSRTNKVVIYIKGVYSTRRR